jgi:hypothetical protein
MRIAYVAGFFLRHSYVAHKNQMPQLRSRNVVHSLTTPRKRSMNMTVSSMNYMLKLDRNDAISAQIVNKRVLTRASLRNFLFVC